jgi:hypothetical protein
MVEKGSTKRQIHKIECGIVKLGVGVKTVNRNRFGCRGREGSVG